MCHFPRLYNQVLYIMQTPYIARIDFYFFPPVENQLGDVTIKSKSLFMCG